MRKPGWNEYENNIPLRLALTNALFLSRNSPPSLAFLELTQKALGNEDQLEDSFAL
jgi:hypothetical protein